MPAGRAAVQAWGSPLAAQQQGVALGGVGGGGQVVLQGAGRTLLQDPALSGYLGV